MFDDLREKIKSVISGRQRSYKRIFGSDNEDVKLVLKDLAKFCRANESCFHQDVRIHANFEGRREVYLRIMEHLKLTPDEYWDKYGKEVK